MLSGTTVSELELQEGASEKALRGSPVFPGSVPFDRLSDIELCGRSLEGLRPPLRYELDEPRHEVVRGRGI